MWGDFLEWDFVATFWSMIGLAKLISPMKRRCDLSVTPKIFGMKASSIPLRPSLVSRTCRDLSREDVPYDVKSPVSVSGHSLCSRVQVCEG